MANAGRGTRAKYRGGAEVVVLAVSSGGGHWVELLRLRPSFSQHSIHFVTVQKDYRADVADFAFHTVRDATQRNPLGMLMLSVQMLFLLLRIRPNVVISTGAAPGYFAVRFGKWVGARTIWVDSLANVETLSKAGAMIGPFADLWLTQWPELAAESGPEYAGSVL